NEAVGILVDQNSLLDEGVFIDFFGMPACTNSAFVRLAAHTGAAVIPGFALWSPGEGRYVLHFYPPVAMTGTTIAATQRLHGIVEVQTGHPPHHWLGIPRRWKTRPPGTPSLY